MISRLRACAFAIAAALAASFPAAADEAAYTIVLDPGHGGRDGGAVGRLGTIEKLVTLQFATLLRGHLEETPSIEVLLTREGDRATSLRSRVETARENEADLLVSIHADSIRHANVRGASIYTLAKTASDAVARSLQESEARSDMLAGFGESGAEDEEVGDILLDLLRDETEAFSRSFADRAIQSMGTVGQTIRNPHRSANFQVLRAPDVPSVLVELGYLSNRKDEELLSDPKWLDRMAAAFADAVVEHARQTGALATAATR